MTPLDTALQWHDLGVATIPIGYKSKKPKFSSFQKTKDIKNGKVVWNPFKKTLPNNQKINIWFKNKYTNIAIITGWKNLVILDFDNLPIWELWKIWIDNVMPELLHHTYRVLTRRGQHIYLFVDNPPERTLKIQTNEEDPKKRNTLIDIKAAGGYCLIPPSIHPSGHVYQSKNTPLDILTVGKLEDVLPKNLLKQTQKEVVIPKPKKKKTNIWEIEDEPCIGGEDLIKYVKQNCSILDFFPNAIPSGQGRWYKVICPFHNDHNESAWLDVQNNRFGCQAGCVGRGLDVIDFYCLLKNVDRSQALRELSR